MIVILFFATNAMYLSSKEKAPKLALGKVCVYCRLVVKSNIVVYRLKDIESRYLAEFE